MPVLGVIVRYFHPPKKSYFLFGPRGTGKSTWARQFYRQAAFLDLLEPDNYRLYKAAPERLYEFVKTHEKKTTVFVIDEVQKLVLETLVAQTFRAWLDYSATSGQLFFWRSKSGLEVDFVIYGEIGFYAIEVKNTSRICREDLSGLIEFQKDYPNATCILLYHCKEKMRNEHNILCYPVEVFLKEAIPDQALPD